MSGIRERGVWNMMKRMMKCKKILATAVLIAMAVSAVAPTVQAAYKFAYSGSREGRNGAYYSHTVVSVYDEKGNHMNATAGACMVGTVWKYRTQAPTATVDSDKVPSRVDAKHQYGVSQTIYGEWTQN